MTSCKQEIATLKEHSASSPLGFDPGRAQGVTLAALATQPARLIAMTMK
jgi:hypothetical protein